MADQTRDPLDLLPLPCGHPASTPHQLIAGAIWCSLCAEAEAKEGLHPYRVLCVQFEPTHREEWRTYEAESLQEALQMAERADAGKVDQTYGIHPEHYAQAYLEGISFNEADGLLID